MLYLHMQFNRSVSKHYMRLELYPDSHLFLITVSPMANQVCVRDEVVRGVCTDLCACSEIIAV